MTLRDELKSAIINLGNQPMAFEEIALEVFKYQYHLNPVYKLYVDSLKKDTKKIDRIEKIPFLPIEFFKTHQVLNQNAESQLVFESSGTTSQNTSQHHIADLTLYELLSKKSFEQFYGPLTDYHIFALLPSYLERNNSSLVYMVQNFLYYSYSTQGGFFLDNLPKMFSKIKEAAKSERKILLLGVSFALLDVAENENFSNILKDISSKLTVMETGGMKGRRKELIREELHGVLTGAFGVNEIHSEYGMTELLSQGYSKGNGIFELPATMKILLREINDPFTYLPSFAIGDQHQTVKYRGKTGGINVIDLANIDSCSFIETKDLGSFTEDYSKFSVMGRFDHSDVRGCNLLVS